MSVFKNQNVKCKDPSCDSTNFVPKIEVWITQRGLLYQCGNLTSIGLCFRMTRRIISEQRVDGRYFSFYCEVGEARCTISLFALWFQCPPVRGAFALVVCSLHRFCLVTGSEEEHSPVLRALGRSAARTMPSKSLDDISSDSASENKVCPLSMSHPSLRTLVRSSMASLHAGMHRPPPPSAGATRLD